MKISDRRSLSRTGLAVPVFGLGCSQAGGLYRAMDDAEATALFDTAWTLGVRLFDTAPYDGYTRSGRRVGAALGQRARDAYLVSTKVGWPTLQARGLLDARAPVPGDRSARGLPC